MIQEIFSQLSSLLEHLGQKRIAVVDFFGYSIRFDFDTVIMSWIVIALLVVLALVLRRSLRRPVDEKPTRVQAALDGLMGVLDGQFASSFSSESLGRRMFPFVSTLFLYVLFSNWLSVIPYLQSPTQNLNVTAGLALLVFVVSHSMAIRMKGVRGFLKGFIEPYPFMLPINLVGEVAKPLSHAFRLFGNVFAGGTMVAVVTAKIFPVVIPTGLSAFYGLFSGLIQAFVFAILAVAYINIAVEG